MNRRIVLAASIVLAAIACGHVSFDMSGSDGKPSKTLSDAKKAGETVKQFKSALDAYNAALDEVSGADARAIGQATAVELLRRSDGLELDEKISAYVTDVGNLVAVAGAPEKPNPRQKARRFFFAVLKDETPNAYSAPGGYVFVTTGLLSHLETESELAFVLGHEIAHVDHDDGLTALKLARGVPAAVEDYCKVKDNPIAQIFLSQPVFDDAALRLADLAVEDRGFFGRKAERDADATGIDYARKAGYDDAAALRVLDMLSHANGPAAGDDDSHDSAGIRLEKLRSRIKHEGVEGLERYQQTVLSRLEE